MTLRADLIEQGIAAYRANALLPGQPAVEVIPLFPPDSDVIVEWRACTVAIIDSLVPDINHALGYFTFLLKIDCSTGGAIAPLSLAQILEAGTWKAGRELAEVSRPNTKEPPIGLLGSDGTVCPSVPRPHLFLPCMLELTVGFLNGYIFGASQEDRYLHSSNS